MNASRKPRLFAPLVVVAVVLPLLAGCSLRIGQPTVVQVSGGISAPVEVRQFFGATQVLVQVAIKGKGPFTFILDTGASTTAIDQSVAHDLGLRRAGRPHPVTGIGGSVEATPVSISDWSIGPIRLPAATIDSATFASDQTDTSVGLLGSDILSQFGVVTIDYDAKTLTVYRQIA